MAKYIHFTCFLKRWMKYIVNNVFFTHTKCFSLNHKPGASGIEKSLDYLALTLALTHLHLLPEGFCPNFFPSLTTLDKKVLRSRIERWKCNQKSRLIIQMTVFLSKKHFWNLINILGQPISTFEILYSLLSKIYFRLL